jgi:hypothetical protein
VDDRVAACRGGRRLLVIVVGGGPSGDGATGVGWKVGVEEACVTKMNYERREIR